MQQSNSSALTSVVQWRNIPNLKNGKVHKILSHKPSDHSYLFPKPRPKILSTPLLM